MEESIKDRKIRLKLWDLSGEEQHKNIPKKFYYNCQGIILVFDVTNIIIFYKLKETFQEVSESLNGKIIDIMLIGNKIDLTRSVIYEQGYKLALENNSLYYETSAKEDDKIKDAMNLLLKSIDDRLKR